MSPSWTAGHSWGRQPAMLPSTMHSSMRSGGISDRTTGHGKSCRPRTAPAAARSASSFHRC
eukprot:7280671-Lingulodinium_polyedra.AAC.1